MKQRIRKSTAVLIMIMLVQFLFPPDVLAEQEDPTSSMTEETVDNDLPSGTDLDETDQDSGFSIGETPLDPEISKVLASIHEEQGQKEPELLFE